MRFNEYMFFRMQGKEPATHESIKTIGLRRAPLMKAVYYGASQPSVSLQISAVVYIWFL
jgi:hypothetical protein